MSEADHRTPEKRFDPWLAVSVVAYVGFWVVVAALLIWRSIHGG